MKVKLNPLAQDAGNALLTTVIFVMVLTLSIGGYMTYVLQQARMNGRSQAWNMAIAVSEAGVEEGFEHLNDDQTNMAADGWVSLGSGNYSVTRSNLPGTFTSSYTVTLNYANPAEPTITSVATVTPPAVARKAPRPFFYAAVNNQTGPTSVARGVQVILTKPTFFNAAVVAKGSINLNGNRVTVDSFDSGTPGQNVNGQWASSVSGDDGIVASDGGITNSAVTLGNANIYGQLYIGPNEPESVGPNGFVGTHAWVAGGGSGIETGDLHTDANFNFPDTSLPPGYQYYTTPQPGSVLLVNGTNVIAATNNNATIFPTGLTNGQTLSAVVTNTTMATVSTYPGVVQGLQSNKVFLTVGTYPGAQPGLTTNCVNTVTVTVNPGPEPCLSTATTVTNVSSASQIPSPSPSGTLTNMAITTNWNGGHNKITGYSTNTSYSYPVTYYTYANVLSYTYQSWTYSYPTTTYSYVLYSSVLMYMTNNYDAVLSGGKYLATSLGNTIVTGQSTLVMPNGYSIANLTIAPGGSLTIYIDGSSGSSLSLDGNTVVNQPGLAQDLIILCTPNITSFSMGGNSGINAVVVAPNADVSLHGGGNNETDFSGSLMAKSVTLSGKWNFHYDVALSRIPSPGRYILASWKEIPVTAGP